MRFVFLYVLNCLTPYSKSIFKLLLCCSLSCLSFFAISKTHSIEQNVTNSQETVSQQTQPNKSENPSNPSTSSSQQNLNSQEPKDQLIKTSLSLLFILILLLGILWFLKRIGFGTGKRMGGFYRILATSSLGPKDKLVLIEIGDSWLLLGITSTSINTLHSMPAGSLTLNSEHNNTAEQFAKLLNRFNTSKKIQSELNKSNDAASLKEHT